MSRGDGDFVQQMVIVRHYLRNGRPESGSDILDDAFQAAELGALEIVRFCLQLRANVRTRRQLSVVAMQWRLVRVGGHPAKRWYTALCKHVLGQFRQWRQYAYPMQPRQHDPSLSQRLSRSVRRQLGYTGAVQVEMATLAEQATVAAEELWESVRGKQCLIWIDNWYCERYGTNPDRSNLSTDLTALAVLILSSTADTPAARTRSHTLPDFRGHVSLHHMTLRVDAVDLDVRDTLRALMRKVEDVLSVALHGSWLRVPLDLQRPERRTLQWRALSVSQDRVSANVELVRVMADVLTLRDHTGGVLPMVVDEKVHYTLLRMMHSRLFGDYDVAGWLQHVPLLYGVWHPYKQALALVYRAFFPVFALLESTGVPRADTPLRCQRKVLYMEKMVGALLLCARPVRRRLQAALRASTSPSTQHAPNAHAHPRNNTP